MKRKLGCDNREMILRGFDEYIEVEYENEREERDGEVFAVVEEAEMEGGVVEEAIGVEFGGGARKLSGGIVKKGPAWN